MIALVHAVQSNLNDLINPILLGKVPEKSVLERDIEIENLIPLAKREGNRKKPIYEMHKWWARRLGINSRTLLIAATTPSSRHDITVWRELYGHHKPSDLVVLDPFMGGGTSLVEAAKLGAHVLGNDIDPMAWFVTKKELDEWSEYHFKRELNWISESIAEKLRSYYKTKDEDGEFRDVIYCFWVEIIPCPHCHAYFEGHVHYYLRDDHEHYQTRRRVAFCKKCHAIKELTGDERSFTCEICGISTDCDKGPMSDRRYTCPSCGKSGLLREIYPLEEPLEKKLFALEYVNAEGDRSYKRADDADVAQYERAAKDLKALRKDLPIPSDKIPSKNRLDTRPIIFGYKRYHQMFNDRQLLCLGLILKEIQKIADRNTREYFLLAFSDCLAANNWFCSYAFGYRKLTPLFGIHSYRRISRPVEGNVWGSKRGRGTFINTVEKIIRGKGFGQCSWELDMSERKPKRVETMEVCNVRSNPGYRSDDGGGPRAVVKNGDSRDLSWILDQSVDIILTDPPYYDNLPYSEMSDFYYVWLKDIVEWPTEVRSHSPMSESLVVNPDNNGRDHERFIQGLTEVFAECHRVLKPDGLMVFTYHHKRANAWMALAEAIKLSGFNVVNVFPMLSEGKSGFHSFDGSLKWDEVMVCRPVERTQLKQFIGKGLKERIDVKVNAWTERLNSSNAAMGKSDQISLHMGMTAAYITRTNVQAHEIKMLFQQLYEASGDDPTTTGEGR